MKYLRLTFDYLFKIEKGKHLVCLTLLALLPCLGFAYFLPMSGLFDFLINYPQGAETFIDFLLMLVNRSTFDIGILLGSAILSIISLSAIISLVSRNLRVGKFKIDSLFNAINDSFFPSLYAVGFYTVSILILIVLLLLFLFFFQSVTNVLTGHILSIVFSIGALVLMCIGYTLYSVWIPIMSFNGIKPTTATVMSYRKTRINGKAFFFSLFAPVLCCLGLGLLGYFCRHIWYLEWLINSMAYALLMTFLTTQSIVSYFDLECIPREDLTRYPFYRRT